MAIHNEGLDAGFSPARRLMEIGPIKGGIKRFRAKITEQGMLIGSFRKKDTTETPRIMKAKRPATVEHKIHMIVFSGGKFRVYDSKTARHPQMNHQGTLLTNRKKQVFSPTPRHTNGKSF
jgi:hypothetical protein